MAEPTQLGNESHVDVPDAHVDRGYKRRYDSVEEIKKPISMETIDNVSPLEELDAKLDEIDSSKIHPVNVPVIDGGFVYKMNSTKRGLFIIINNKTFTRMNERRGTDADALHLYNTFKQLDFDVRLYNNLVGGKMKKLVKEVSQFDHSESDMFAMAILSHGDEGIVYGTDDSSIDLETLFGPLKGNTCETLVGKPKIIIIQACRGTNMDHGVQVSQHAPDSGNLQVKKIPTEADFLYAYSTPPGYFSWRNTQQGSWFVHALCRVLREHGGTKEIMWILTRTNHLVAYDYQASAGRQDMDRMKQIPSIVSQLTKELYLTQKSK